MTTPNQLLTSRAILGMFAKELGELTTPEWVGLISWLNDDSNQAEEEYAWLNQNPSFRDWIGGRKAHQVGDQSVIVPNTPLEVTIELSKRDRMKDKTGQLQKRISQLVRSSAGRHWQQALTPLVINGAASVATYGANRTYDAANFFGNGHRADADGNAQDNRVSVSGLSGGRPTVVQVQEGLQKAVETMLGFVDEHQEPANEDLSELLVMAPPSFVGVVSAALNLQVTQGSGGAINNPVMGIGEALGFRWRMTSNTRLNVDGWGTGSTRRIGVFRTDDDAKPFIRQEVQAPTPTAKGEGSEFEFDTDHHQYGVTAERGSGYGMWEHAVRVEFAA